MVTRATRLPFSMKSCLTPTCILTFVLDPSACPFGVLDGARSPKVFNGARLPPWEIVGETPKQYLPWRKAAILHNVVTATLLTEPHVTARARGVSWNLTTACS